MVLTAIKRNGPRGLIFLAALVPKKVVIALYVTFMITLKVFVPVKSVHGSRMVQISVQLHRRALLDHRYLATSMSGVQKYNYEVKMIPMAFI